MSKINPQSAKIRTANTVKQVLKQANQRFCPYLVGGTFNRLKITSECAKNRTANAVKPVSKPVNERFRPYLGSGTFNKHKINFKELRIEQ